MKFFKHILYLPALLLTTQGAFAQISKAGSETAVNTTTAKQQRAASIGTSSSGAYVVIWESEAQDGDDGGIYFKLFDSSGSLVLAETLMNSFNTVNAQSFANVSMNSAGKFVTTWMSEDGASDTDGWGIRYSLKDASGANIVHEGRANSTKTGNQKFPSVALSDNGGFVIVWENEGDISSRRYNSNGASLNFEFNVNTNTNGAQLYPDVAIDSDGDFVIVWQSDTTGGNFDIHAQRYNNAGVAQGTEFKVNTTEAQHQISPKVAMDDAGNFVVSWSSYAQDGDGFGIYARRFLSDGTAASAEFLVNTTTSSTQHHSSVDIGSDGSYIISWTSFGEDGDNAGVYAQAFSPTDVKKGSAVLVNTTTSAFQTLPAVSMTDDAGKALFAWQSGEPDSTNTQDGDDYGIFLQSFDVADMVDPVAVAQDLTVYLDANGDVAISGADLDNGSTDNVGVTSYTASKIAFDCNDLGSDNTVTLTVADAAGNEDTDTSVITVLDTISPVVVTQDITITLNSEGVASFSDQDIDNGSTDNCGIASYVASNTVFGNSDLGENEVTLTVTDDSGNDKSATATVTVVKIAQSITFDALSPVTYGDADFGLGATASSGLSVNYSSSNTSVAVINGTSVEIIGVGTTTITASQAGDANHDAAADVQRLLTVNELPITVTADDKSKDFGDADPGFTFSVTSGALVGSDSFTGDLTRDAGESLGQYDITVGTLSAGSNYDLTYVKGVFEIFDLTDPVFTSSNTFSVAEGATGTVFTAMATDLRTVSYALGTGGDESLFNISDGAVSFKNAPDFETPVDGNTDNIYIINVEASDGVNTVTQAVSITVTDVDEIDPVFTSGTEVDFAENGEGTAYTAAATDANAITYSLGAGNDESDFNIDGSTGIVTFKSSPDFESPADGDTNNDYVIDVKADDGLNEAVLSVTITVTDVDEIDPVFTSGTAVNFAENAEGTAYTAAATDANAITYSLGAGNDESDFNIDVTTGIVTFKSSPDFENPTDGDTNNDYVIEVKANDGLNEAVQTVTITVTDVDEIDPVFTSGTAVDFAENGMGTAYAAVATDANVITYSLGSGNDESLFNIDGSTGIVTFIVSPDFENPTDGNTDNAYVIAVKANDGLNEVSQIVTITVTDVFEDPARPNLIGSDPLDDATDFAGTTITLTFDRNVFKGSGTIEVLDASDDAQLFSKGVNHADISINGAVVTIDMKSALALDKDVYLNVPATAFKDVNDGFFLGITDKTTLNFSTPSSPVLVSSTPADDAVEFGGTTIDLTFDRTMSKGNGLITLFDASDDSQVWSVGVNNPNVTINGSMVSLSVGSLSEDKAYYLNIGASALKDTNGRSYAGISDNSTLNFASLTSPVLLASNPMDNAIDFSGTSISLTFDSDMSKGAGVITLFDASDDSHVWSVGVNNPNVAITGTVVTLNTGSLPLDKDFYLNVGASALMDAQGLKYAGISDKTTLNFSGQTSPQLISSSPADGATGYDGTTVALTFDRNMLKGAGTVSLSDASTDAQVWARGINHPDITINGATVTFAVGTLPIDKEFYVNIASTALKDATGLFYAGIADKTTLNFFGRTSPVLVSSTPEDDAIDFDATSIVLNFDKDVSKGAGTISLKDASDDSELWGVGVNHPNVVVSGSTVTLNVGALPLDEDFYLNIGSQAFKDNQDAFYSGISDKTTLNFSGPTTPKLISSNPADDATGFSGTSMTLTFDRNVVKGYGAIAIFDASDDSKLKGAGVNVGAITINGAVVTINLGGGLPVDKDAYLNIAATAFKDADNRFYAGISDKTTLNFDTNTPVPSRNPSDLTQEVVDEQQSGVWLYPNPATNKITIDLSAAGEAPNVQITDATGAGKFLKEKVEQRLLTIDVSQYAGGIYIALVRNQDGTISRQKFMIRR